MKKLVANFESLGYTVLLEPELYKGAPFERWRKPDIDVLPKNGSAARATCWYSGKIE
jgi:hypothetical protein